jgi:hypothetical protein
MKNFLVYIAGPYTKGDVAENVATAIDYGDKVAGFGYAVEVPHLSHFWHYRSWHDYEFWMDLDLVKLARCDCLLRIPGPSSGADREVDFCKENEIPFKIVQDDFLEETFTWLEEQYLLKLKASSTVRDKGITERPATITR